MKPSLAAVVLSVFCLPAASDELVLTSGRTIVWTSLKDEGVAYTVLTRKGLTIRVPKKDIEKVVVKDAGELLTGSLFTPLDGRRKKIDALGLIDPKRDFYGAKSAAVRRTGRALSCLFHSDAPCRVRTPFTGGAEYDVDLVVERKNGVGDFFVGLPVSGRWVLVRIDAEKMTRSGASGRLSVNRTQRPLLPEGETKPIRCHVREGGAVLVKVGDHVVWESESDQGGALPPGYALPEGTNALFFGSRKVYGTSGNDWIIHRCLITLKR